MSVDTERMRAALEPAVTALGLTVYDVELTGNGGHRVLRVSVQDPAGPVDLEALTDTNRALGPIADELVPGHYELEVSSPGIERALRRPEHFQGALGELVTLKHTATPDGAAVRDHGRLVAADDDTVTLELDADSGSGTRRVPYAAVTAARTVFEWGSPPRRERRPQPRSAKEHTKR